MDKMHLTKNQVWETYDIVHDENIPNTSTVLTLNEGAQTIMDPIVTRRYLLRRNTLGAT